MAKASRDRQKSKSAQATLTMAALVVPLLLLWHIPSFLLFPRSLTHQQSLGKYPAPSQSRPRRTFAGIASASCRGAVLMASARSGPRVYLVTDEKEDQSPECRSATVGNHVGRRSLGVLGWLFHSARDKREQARAVAARRRRYQQRPHGERNKLSVQLSVPKKVGASEQLQNERLRRQKRRQKRKRARKRAHGGTIAPFGAFGSRPRGPFARSSFGDESAPGAHLGEDDGHNDDDGGDDSTDDGGSGHGDGDGSGRQPGAPSARSHARRRRRSTRVQTTTLTASATVAATTTTVTVMGM